MQLRLNENYIYNLSELTSEEYKKLYNWLLINDKGWEYVSFEDWKNKKCNLKYNRRAWYATDDKPTSNAKELFYTLEDVQVNCTELSENQIKEVACIFESSGKKLAGSLGSTKIYSFIYTIGLSYVIQQKADNKTTITYEKFIELFGETKKLEEKSEPRIDEKSILQEAEQIINGSRAEDYGSVTENFSNIARGWEIIFEKGITPRKVAHAMTWLKICRDINTEKDDNIIDIAGYAGCVGKMINEANQ